MNYNLSQIPERTKKPRERGITMVMDKGLSLREAENFIEASGSYVDLVKIGFGTSFVTPNLKAKLKLYRDAGMHYYFGGTLFEAFIIRNNFEGYKNLMEEFELRFVEVSDGCIEIDHELKCDYINQLSEKAIVLSEVGSKDDKVILPPYKWIELIQNEINAGSWKVIAESRESGSVGIYRGDGEVRMGLVDEILYKIEGSKILWEAPKKAQQAWFIKLQGHNVNLGNIAPNDVIPLETLRVGLRGDTFFDFLDKK